MKKQPIVKKKKPNYFSIVIVLIIALIFFYLLNLFISKDHHVYNRIRVTPTPTATIVPRITKPAITFTITPMAGHSAQISK